MRRPQVEPVEGLPERVTIYEVGARDGLQNEKQIVQVQDKAEFVRLLAHAGLETIEVTSFVSPRWVPQLADAEALLDNLRGEGLGRHRPVLVPNERGLERALARGVSAVAIFGSATESFSQSNLNRSIAESIAGFAPVVSRAKDEGAWVRAYLSMCFGDPWEGDVPIAQVVDVARRLMDLGCDELSLGDTIGVATTGHVQRLIEALGDAGLSVDRLAVHFHDTYGQALANIYACLELGIATFDTSAAGLGGCPYAKGATGNVATEDVVYLLHGLGIDTGIDLTRLRAAGAFISDALGRASASRVARALAARDEQAAR